MFIIHNVHGRIKTFSIYWIYFATLCSSTFGVQFGAFLKNDAVHVLEHIKNYVFWSGGFKYTNTDFKHTDSCKSQLRYVQPVFVVCIPVFILLPILLLFYTSELTEVTPHCCLSFTVTYYFTIRKCINKNYYNMDWWLLVFILIYVSYIFDTFFCNICMYFRRAQHTNTYARRQQFTVPKLFKYLHSPWNSCSTFKI